MKRSLLRTLLRTLSSLKTLTGACYKNPSKKHLLLENLLRTLLRSVLLHDLSGPLNRLNAILALLHPLDRYRTLSCDRECDWEALSRPISLPRTGRRSQPPSPKPLSRNRDEAMQRVAICTAGRTSGASSEKFWGFWSKLLRSCPEMRCIWGFPHKFPAT